MTESSQRLVSHHFQATADAWRDLYDRQDVYARMYQNRRDAVLKFVDSLPLPQGARILEAGCGPGVTSVELARRGFAVHALDFAPAMIRLTRKLAFESGASVRLLLGDVTHLPFPDHAFTLALAIGVTEWVKNLEPIFAQLARVVAPGGHVIVTTDNRWALYRLLDPSLNPMLDPLKRFMRRSEGKPRSGVYSMRQLDRALGESGFAVVSGRTLGFGPFSMFKVPLFSDALAIRVQRKLQSAADWGLPVLRDAGHVYAVLARKELGMTQHS